MSRSAPRSTPQRARSPTQKRLLNKRPHPPVPTLLAYMNAFGRGSTGKASREEFARKAGTHLFYIDQIAKGLRRCSMDLAMKIERASHNQVKCEHILPDSDWVYAKARELYKHNNTRVGKTLSNVSNVSAGA
jgi:DNA-binding transcriptional regulator YdaS (Cro superfamily)